MRISNCFLLLFLLLVDSLWLGLGCLCYCCSSYRNATLPKRMLWRNGHTDNWSEIVLKMQNTELPHKDNNNCKKYCLFTVAFAHFVLRIFAFHGICITSACFEFSFACHLFSSVLLAHINTHTHTHTSPALSCSFCMSSVAVSSRPRSRPHTLRCKKKNKWTSVHLKKSTKSVFFRRLAYIYVKSPRTLSLRS